MCPSIEITQLFLHLLLDKWLAACPHGSSVAMQIQGLLLVVCTLTSWTTVSLLKSRHLGSYMITDFLKKQSKNKYIAV